MKLKRNTRSLRNKGETFKKKSYARGHGLFLGLFSSKALHKLLHTPLFGVIISRLILKRGKREEISPKHLFVVP